MDNRESHCTLDSMFYARENGITLVTFPLDCSHRLQPLDVGVMGPFKEKLCVAHVWMTANSGNVITIHDLSSMTNAAYRFFYCEEYNSSFAKPVIRPFSRLEISDEDFEPLFFKPMEKRTSLTSDPCSFCEHSCNRRNFWN